MDNSFQTSFIPKKPVTPGVPSVRAPRSLFSVIATFLLVAVLVISLGLFVYKIYLTKQKESFTNSLVSAKDSFEQGTIDELELFNKRTESAKELLNKHIAISPIFKLLQEITIPSIQYTSFEQTTDDNGFLVKMVGTAKDYRSIALQADMFSSSKGLSFKNVVFSNLVKDKNNNIVFDLKFNVDPTLISYDNANSLNNTTADTQSVNTTTQTTQEGSPIPSNLENNTQQ